MFSAEVLFLGLALAMDAAVVSFALGILSIDLDRNEKFSRTVKIGLLFGFFQFLMLWIGSYGGYLFAFSSYGHMSQLIVALIFLLIGFKFFQESMDQEAKKLEWGLLPLVILSLATSVDALAAGISFGTLPSAYMAALEVGIVTSVVCGIFFNITRFLHHIPEKWLLRIAGVVFLYLGGEIIWNQYLRGVL